MIETYAVGPKGIPIITKTLNGQLTYGFLWGDYLALISDTLAADSPVTVTADAGITVLSTLVIGTTVQVKLGGGTLGLTYNVNCQIRTASGEVDDRSILVKIGPR